MALGAAGRRTRDPRRPPARATAQVVAAGAALLVGALVVRAGRSYVAFQQGSSAPQASAAEVGRRSVLRGMAAAASVASLAGGPGDAAWAAADSGAKKVKSKFAGTYYDPEHEGCKREVFLNFDGTAGKLVGQDSFSGGECKSTDSQKKWSLKVSLQGPDAEEISIQEDTRSVTTRKPREKSQGAPSPVVAKWDGSGIVFPDGTKWTKAEYYEKPEYEVKKMKARLFR